jgi:plasmid stabilization system protein ParE
MSLPVVLLPEAQDEFDDAFDWYEQQRPGLGLTFVGRVQDAFDRIAANPLMYRIVFQDVRKAVVRQFPYHVLFREEAHQTLVLAVFHNRRDRSVWRARV